MSMDPERIRNFCIIAHIDHGKSTLADRILERTGQMADREQMLDDMDLERERGITIKAKSVALPYESDAGEAHLLDLIDTPGHVDFSYEVSRSLTACEGAVLVVDAAQGVEAQTVATFWQAVEVDLEIIPVINKIDLAAARPWEVREEMETSLGIDPADVLEVSAKTGEGVDELLEAIVERIPPPTGDPDGPLRALVFDATYDTYRGVVIYVRVVDGRLEHGEKFRLMKSGVVDEVTEIGVFRPAKESRDGLRAGEVGYVIASLKTLSEVHIGDTVVHPDAEVEALPGYQEPQRMVFCALYPTDNDDYDDLRSALEKLSLNDASFDFQPEVSEALGFGFRCGFLGLLHMEIVQERLEREMGIDLVQTSPNVTYEILTEEGETLRVDNPAKLPEWHEIEEFREPWVNAQILIPSEAIGPTMALNEDRRGRFRRQEWIGSNRVLVEVDLPLAELIIDYYDQLKSATRGYGTLDYSLAGYEASELTKLTILVGGKEVDALSTVVHEDEVRSRAHDILGILKDKIPRHMFRVPLQAKCDGRIVLRMNIKPVRKDVTSKCYGGDVTRKRKLLEKQKEGKRRMKQVGKVEIPQEAFLAALRTPEED